jgi:hypothetical protein
VVDLHVGAGTYAAKDEGTSDGYAHLRSFVDANDGKVLGYTIE